MGGKNKARKTRWRALEITDEHNSDDSEESNLTSSSVLSSGRVSEGYHSHNSRPYYSNKYSYSSQSTPRRRFYEGSTKSTRSSSTASETKITLIDDEYTRITTPRQDVLFKKGYLNKPKVYQSQTSTGASTISTENSTENGTPDHQSTDLDYESQFVFPNGFVDQNGIYYVNSYEPYPLMLFNPPTYFHEFSDQKSSDHKSKRYSTGSLTESMSPNTEEATSQDFSHSGGDTSNNVSDYGGQPLYNLVYPGYYVNSGPCPTNGPITTEPVKKLKKRRERKSSKNVPGDSTENTTDGNSTDEENHTKARLSRQTTPLASTPNESSPLENSENHVTETNEENSTNFDNSPSTEETKPPVPSVDKENLLPNVEPKQIPPETLETESKTEPSITQNSCADVKTDITQENNINTESNQAQPEDNDNQQETKPKIDLSQSNLKPEAEEFVPRVYQTLPNPPTHIIPSNFVPIPLVLNDFGGQPFAPHQAFIPPGIPINIMPPPHPGHKMFPPIFAPPHHLPHKMEEMSPSHLEKITEDKNNITRTPNSTPPNTVLANNKTIDIATVVSKLEEAVKEREENLRIEEQLQKTLPAQNSSYRGSGRFNRQPYRKNFNKYRTPLLNSAEYPPIGGVKHVQTSNRDTAAPKSVTEDSRDKFDEAVCLQTKNVEKKIQENGDDNKRDENNQNSNTASPKAVAVNNSTNTVNNNKNLHQQVRNSPERSRKNVNQIHAYQSNPNSPKRQPNFKRSFSENTSKNSREFAQQRSQENRSSNKNYSEMLKKSTPVFNNSNKKHINEDKNANNPKKIYSTASNSVVNSSNQWVSVSSRKKKKNQNFQDFDTEKSSENEESITKVIDECFEPYDINQLEDVVPSVETKQEINRIDKISTDLAEEVNKESKSIVPEPAVKIDEVKNIEKESLMPNEQSNVEELLESNKTEPETIQQIVVECDTEKPTKSNKKSKKNTQKPLTRRVIIKDIDLSGELEESKPENLIEKENPTNTPNKETTDNKTDIEKESIVKEIPEKKSKKKKKNKTKKPSLNDNLSDSNTTLSTVEESCDLLLENSLLNTSLEKTNVEMTAELDKLIQKSMFSSLKDKIKSVDLDSFDDKFFQKLGTSSGSKNGFNKTPDFNKIFQSNRQFLKPNSGEISNSWTLPATDYPDAQPRKDSTALRDVADPSIKTDDCIPEPHKDDLSTKPAEIPEVKDQSKSKAALDICSSTTENESNQSGQEQEETVQNQAYEEEVATVIAPDQENTEFVDKERQVKCSGDINPKDSEETFAEEAVENHSDLENGEAIVNECKNVATETGEEKFDEDSESSNSDQNEKKPHKPKLAVQEEDNSSDTEEKEKTDALHPITAAVKIWMTRTREVTPDIELLKSPSEIYKELRQSQEREDDSSDSQDDEEIVIFISRKSSSQESDLLEYWENEIKKKPANSEESLVNDVCINDKESGTCTCAKCQKNEVEEGIEVYESKYGQNEAYLNLQKQMNEKDKMTGARYGQLPICCSLQ